MPPFRRPTGHFNPLLTLMDFLFGGVCHVISQPPPKRETRLSLRAHQLPVTSYRQRSPKMYRTQPLSRVLIVGTSGVGFEVAKRLVAKKVPVHLISRDAAKLAFQSSQASRVVVVVVFESRHSFLFQRRFI